ncbi:MAG: DUF1080 domain-containing protein [Opitutales bacterium]|jgi:hypothetical protein|nr:DUF1080 domain-containing protein [Opitutales bacterium]
MQIALKSISLLFLASMSLIASEPGKTTSLFDGQTLEGWKTVRPGDSKFWSVIDGVITGGDAIQKIPHNSFLQTVKEFEDFEFRCLFRISGDPSTGLINSGIQYRSSSNGKHMIGYQADIGNRYWGDIYDEHRRNKALLKGELATLNKILNPMGWNSYIIRCKGNHHETYINGVKVADYIEEDPSIPTKGVFGIQLHSGGNCKVEFSDITITEF